MKLLSVLIFAGSMALSASTYSQKTKIDLRFENSSLMEILNTIEKNSEFIFIYNEKVVNLDLKKSITVNSETIENILNQLFKGVDVTYRIDDRQVFLYKKEEQKKADQKKEGINSEQPQKKELSGKVKDAKGITLPGVSVVVKGTTTGTITDTDGNFRLLVATDAKTLVFSFVGMKSQEFPIEGKTTISVVMAEDAVGIDEVVVVGYGTQTKASVVGAISTVKVADLKTVSASNLTNSIGGQVSGLITKMQEGKPGDDDSQILIRGMSTTNNTAPLVLIDGMEGSFGAINPSDIESFSVLKDASATAVYGVRGANGVILIATKRGSIGKPKIKINSQIRLHRIIKYPKLLGSYEYANLYNEAWANSGNTTPYFSDADLVAYRDHTDPYGHPDVNWFDALTKPYALEHMHDINISGGTPKLKYFVSGEIVSKDGVYRQWDDQKYKTNATYDRINIRMNFDFTITKTTDFGINFANRLENTNDLLSVATGDANSKVGLWDEIIQLPPNNNPLHNPDGTYGYYSGFGRGVTPYADLRQGGFKRGRENALQASFKLNQNLDVLTKGLSFRILAGVNTSSGYSYTLTESPAIWYYKAKDSTYIETKRPQLPTASIAGDAINQSYHFETAFNYDRTFNKVHKITALALYNQDKSVNMAYAPVNRLGVAGRLTYGFNNKYLGEINVGYNGSDQFQKGQRFALLPAGSLGWVISEEKYLKENLNFIKYMKIRGSYGTVGNDKLGSGQSYYYKSNYTRGSGVAGGYYFGDNATAVGSINEGTLGNDHVTWEIAIKQNYGIDFTLFSNDLGFSFDYFRENRSNILAQRNTTTQVFGVPIASMPPENIGKVENKGVEFEARYTKKFNDWKINFNGNISYAKNKILFLDEIIQPLDYRNKTGKPIGQQFGYLWSGEFYSFDDLGYVWDESVVAANKFVLPAGALPKVAVPAGKVYPGELKFVDRNNDGVIDAYDNGAIGKSRTPEIIYGLNLGVNYKRFGLQMFWQGATGFNVNFLTMMGDLGTGNVAHEKFRGRWAYFPDKGIDTRETATHPRLMIVSAENPTAFPSSFTQYDCTYIRLKTMEIYYSLPDRLVKSLRIESARIYVTGNNLLTFSKFDFYDPESTGSSGQYPQSQFFGLGLNIGF